MVGAQRRPPAPIQLPSALRRSARTLWHSFGVRLIFRQIRWSLFACGERRPPDIFWQPFRLRTAHAPARRLPGRDPRNTYTATAVGTCPSNLEPRQGRKIQPAQHGPDFGGWMIARMPPTSPVVGSAVRTAQPRMASGSFIEPKIAASQMPLLVRRNCHGPADAGRVRWQPPPSPPRTRRRSLRGLRRLVIFLVILIVLSCWSVNLPQSGSSPGERSPDRR